MLRAAIKTTDISTNVIEQIVEVVFEEAPELGIDTITLCCKISYFVQERAVHTTMGCIFKSSKPFSLPRSLNYIIQYIIQDH